MFDIAFSELVVILLVALVVIGPERLPKVARTAGHLWGRLQRFVTNVKNDVTRDLAIEEARKLHDNIIQEADAAGRALQEGGQSLQQQVTQALEPKPSAAAAEQPQSAAHQLVSPGKPAENDKASHS